MNVPGSRAMEEGVECPEGAGCWDLTMGVMGQSKLIRPKRASANATNASFCNDCFRAAFLNTETWTNSLHQQHS